jgi:RNA-directed DNA polymerase
MASLAKLPPRLSCSALDRPDVLSLPGNVKPWAEVRDQLNAILRGWSAYFCYGTRAKAYKAIDHHLCGRVRHFLSRRHKVPDRGTRRFPHKMIYGVLGVPPLDYRRVPHNETSRKAGCGRPARPV